MDSFPAARYIVRDQYDHLTVDELKKRLCDADRNLDAVAREVYRLCNNGSDGIGRNNAAVIVGGLGPYWREWDASRHIGLPAPRYHRGCSI